MSFNNPIVDLELEGGAPNQYSDFPQFEQLLKSIENCLHIVKNTYLSQIRIKLQEHEKLDKTSPLYHQQALKTVDSVKESVSKCIDAFKSVNQATLDLNEYLKQCELDHADQDSLSYLRQKESILISSTKNALNQFQRQQRKFLALEKLLMASQVAVLDENANGRTTTQQVNEQPQIQITYEPINAEELEQQLLLIQEREQEIHRIAQDTQEINDIYLNLQDIILEQQFQIDTIEDNILSYLGDVQGAASELRRAERYQRRSGGRMLCCLFILLGVFGTVVVIMVVF